MIHDATAPPTTAKRLANPAPVDGATDTAGNPSPSGASSTGPPSATRVYAVPASAYELRRGPNGRAVAVRREDFYDAVWPIVAEHVASDPSGITLSETFQASRVTERVVDGLPDHEFTSADLADRLRQHLRETDAGSADAQGGRRVDLTNYLNGTITPPVPSIGATRNDEQHLLYDAKWHNVIADTGHGKSWFALLHCAVILKNGGTVVYVHAEESRPTSTIDRLRQLGVSDDATQDRFVWLDYELAFSREEFAAEISGAALVVLDGIVEACGRQGWDPYVPAAVAEYRRVFVEPATRRGATVLSLGHPVKSRDRQTERAGLGTRAWLDATDGVSFRLKPSKDGPLGRGRVGRVHLYSVKDREGQVEAHGDAPEDGWTYLGTMVVDDTGTHTQISVHPPNNTDPRADKIRAAWAEAGQRLSQRDTAKATGLSRTTVRRAIEESGLGDWAPAIEAQSAEDSA